jgi:outer membrane protein assembly factor BamB
VYFGGEDRYVYAVDLATGGVTWKMRTQGLVDTSPAVAGGKVMVVSESLSAGVRVYALDQATGKVAWTFSRPPSSERTSSVSTDGRVAYLGLSDRTVQALDVRNGLILWSQPVPVAFTPATAPALASGSVLVADADGGLYRFDARTGTRIWDFQLPTSGLPSRAGPLVSGGVVFLGSSDGTLGAVEIASGQLIWKTRFATGPVGSLTPHGDHLLVSLLGRKGGIVAMDHDPNGTMIQEDSPTDLSRPVALRNYAAAFVLVLGGVWLLFGYLPEVGRRRRSGTEDAGFDSEEEVEPSDHDHDDGDAASFDHDGEST